MMPTNTKESVLKFLEMHLQAIRDVPQVVWVGPVGTEIIRRRTSLVVLQEILVSWPFSVGKFVDEVERRAVNVLTGATTLAPWPHDSEAIAEEESKSTSSHPSFPLQAVDEAYRDRVYDPETGCWSAKYDGVCRMIEGFLFRAYEGGPVARVELLQVGLQGDVKIVEWSSSLDGLGTHRLAGEIVVVASHQAQKQKKISPRYVVNFYRELGQCVANGRQWFTLEGGS